MGFFRKGLKEADDLPLFVRVRGKHLKSMLQ
jgi:hypothetical protein